MNVVCPRTWRALYTGNRNALLRQPTFIIQTWVPVIQPPRSSQPRQASSLFSSWILYNVVYSPKPLFHHASSVNAGTWGCRTKFSTSTRNHDFASTVTKWLTKRKEFSQDEIKSIFGPHMPVSEGNRILYEVQDQRLAGTIDQVTPGTQRYKDKALAWLRKNVPFDEDRAILKRLEREEEAALRPQRQQKGGEVYALSALERLRKENLAKQSKEEHANEAKAALEHKGPPLRREQALVRRREESLAWVQKWHAHAQKDDLHSLPQMSFIQRVGPATLLTFSVVSLCVMFAQNYSPPSEVARLFTSITPAAATVGVLVGLNVIVWFGWRVVPLRRFMQRTFLLVPAYPWSSSMIGCVFSHQSFHHLAANMIALGIIGRNLHEDIGRGPFLAVYLSCGVATSNICLISTVLRKRWEYLTLGCSGALCGMLATWCWINSDKGMRIWPFPPRATEALQPIGVLALFMAMDAWGVWKGLRLGRFQLDSRIDHVSHLVGYGCGIVAAQFLQSPVKPQQKKKNERSGTGPKMQRVENTTDP